MRKKSIIVFGTTSEVNEKVVRLFNQEFETVNVAKDGTITAHNGNYEFTCYIESANQSQSAVTVSAIDRTKEDEMNVDLTIFFNGVCRRIKQL